MTTSLIDGFGREITYVRLSVTDRCDFRCVYCMSEDMQFLPRTQILSLEEIYRVGKAFVDMGVTKLRLTGGEPLVRPNLLWLVERLAALPGLRELTLTTNGSQLGKLAQPLRDAGLSRINISLDSLNADKFHAITRTGRPSLASACLAMRATPSVGSTSKPSVSMASLSRPSPHPSSRMRDPGQRRFRKASRRWLGPSRARSAYTLA